MTASRVEGLHLVESYAEAAARLFRDGVLDEAAARSVVDAARADGLQLTEAEVDALFR